ncbi:MAG: hypothetical protein H6705_06180 [Myxococcales bacterium]|nr:hypothetical protein [Myxococcales bacterium]
MNATGAVIPRRRTADGGAGSATGGARGWRREAGAGVGDAGEAAGAAGAGVEQRAQAVERGALRGDGRTERRHQRHRDAPLAVEQRAPRLGLVAVGQLDQPRGGRVDAGEQVGRVDPGRLGDRGDEAGPAGLVRGGERGDGEAEVQWDRNSG